MLLIHCPYCEEDHPELEFAYAGEAHIARPPDPSQLSDEEWRDYLFIRHNPKGLHFERWRCDRGCGKWFHAARDTVTLDFKAFYGITELPPVELQQQAKGPWAEYFQSRAKAK